MTSEIEDIGDSHSEIGLYLTFVQELFRAGELKWLSDASKFSQIIAVRSHEQLRATFTEYVKISQRDIANSIERNFSGDLKSAMLAMGKE